MKNIVRFTRLFFISLIIFFQTLIAQNQEWQVNSSAVKFKIKNAGFTVDGVFSGLTGKIIFDASKGFGNSIDASIEAKTINTGNEMRDKHLKKTDYFDVVNFPTIRMKATLFGKEANSDFRGHFKLTLKGETKYVLVPFSFVEKDDKAILKGNFTINRLDFGVGESSMIMSNNVVITIELNASKK
jgi:polyisoprenoid-binding protein YceI